MRPAKSSASSARSTGEAEQDSPRLKRARSSMDTFVIAGRTRLPSSSALMPETVDMQIAESLLATEPSIPSQQPVSDNAEKVEGSGPKPFRRHTRHDEAPPKQLHHGLNVLPTSTTDSNQRGIVVGQDLVVSTRPLVIGRARGRNYIPLTSRHASLRSSNKTSATWSTVSHRIFTDSTGSSRMHETLEFIELYNELALKHGLPRHAEAVEAKDNDGVEKTKVTINTKTHSNWLMRKILRRSTSTYSVKVKSKSISRKLSVSGITDLPKRVQRDLLKGQTLEEIGRLGGLSLFTLPPEFAVDKLSIPTCISATATYILQHGRTTPGIFRIPGQLYTVNGIYDFYAQTFSSTDSVSYIVEQTIGLGLLPTHIDYTIHDVASVFKKLISDLPGGLLGSLVLFKALRNIENHFYADPELSESKQIQVKARLIALAIFCVESTHRVSLICAVLGLVSLVGQAAEKAAISARGNKNQMPSELMGYKALAVVFAPLLLGDLNEQFNLHGRDERGGLLTLPESPQKSVKKEKEKKKEKKNAKMNNKLEQSPEMIAKYERLDVTIRVMQMLITLWQDVVTQLRSIGTLHDEKRVVSGHSNVKSSETGSRIAVVRGRPGVVEGQDVVVKRKERISSRSTTSFKSIRSSMSNLPEAMQSQQIERSRSPLSTQKPINAPADKANSRSRSDASLDRLSIQQKPSSAVLDTVSNTLLPRVDQQQRKIPIKVSDNPHAGSPIGIPGSRSGDEDSDSLASPRTPVNQGPEKDPFEASPFDTGSPHYSNVDEASIRSPSTSAKQYGPQSPVDDHSPSSARYPQDTDNEAKSVASPGMQTAQSNGWLSFEGDSLDYKLSPQNENSEVASKYSPHTPPGQSTLELFKKFGPARDKSDEAVSPGSPYVPKRRHDTDLISHQSHAATEPGAETVIEKSEANVGKPLHPRVSYDKSVRRISREYEKLEVNRASPKTVEKNWLEDGILPGLERQQSVKVLTQKFSPKAPAETAGKSPRSPYYLKNKSTARLYTPTKIPRPSGNSPSKTGSPATRTQDSSKLSLIPKPGPLLRSKKADSKLTESKPSPKASSYPTSPTSSSIHKAPAEMGAQISKLCGNGSRKSSKARSNDTPPSRRPTEPFVSDSATARQLDGMTRSPSVANSIQRAPTKKNMLANLTADSLRRGINETDPGTMGVRIDRQTTDHPTRMNTRRDEIFPMLSPSATDSLGNQLGNVAALHVRIRELQKENAECGAALTATTNELEALRRANAGTTRFLQEVAFLRNEVQYWKGKAEWAETRLMAIIKQSGGVMPAPNPIDGGVDGNANGDEDSAGHVMDGTDLQSSEFEGPDSGYPYAFADAHIHGYGTYSSHDAGFDGYNSHNSYASEYNSPIRADTRGSTKDHNDIDPHDRFNAHSSYNSHGFGSDSGHHFSVRDSTSDPNDIDPYDRFNSRNGINSTTNFHAHDGARSGFF